MTDDEYRSFAESELDTQNMEAVVANAEQGFDMPAAIQHQLYIGWILGIARTHDIDLTHVGGNRLQTQIAPNITVTLVVPMPPADWRP